MVKNVGGIDRILRITVGAALILAFFLNTDCPYRWLYWLGLIPLVTGIFQTCPIYRFLGISSCPPDRR